MQETLRDLGLIPGSGRCPGGGHGNPLQYSCLENPVDRGAFRLQSMGLHRVWHDCRDVACTHPKAGVRAAVTSLVLLSASRCTVLVTLQGAVRLQTVFCFYVCLFFMCYLCEKYHKPITVQYYITDCVSWIPRLTLLDLRTCWIYQHSFGTCLYTGDLLYFLRTKSKR